MRAYLELLVESLARFLIDEDLRALDAACRDFCVVNRVDAGPWCRLGRERYRGLRLAFDKEETFDDFVESLPVWRLAGAAHLDWKYGFLRFLKRSKMFQAPYIGNHIVGVYENDETAELRVAVEARASNVYVELSVHENPDRLSLCLADFDWDGNTSLSFHPDSGTVLWERSEADEVVERHLLHLDVDSEAPQEAPQEAQARSFLGSIAMFISEGLMLFALCPRGKVAWTRSHWIPLDWARDGWVRPCVCFRAKGLYRVTVTKVDTAPPFSAPARNEVAQLAPLFVG